MTSNDYKRPNNYKMLNDYKRPNNYKKPYNYKRPSDYKLWKGCMTFLANAAVFSDLKSIKPIA